MYHLALGQPAFTMIQEKAKNKQLLTIKVVKNKILTKTKNTLT